MPGVPYAQSSIDWSRLNAYAARVARETRQPRQAAITKKRSVPTTRTEERRTGIFWKRTEIVSVTTTAVETTEIVGPHWVLHVRTHSMEEDSKSRAVEYHEKRKWILGANGKLMTLWDWQDFTILKQGNVRKPDADLTMKIMDDDDVIALDHQPRRYDQRHRGVHSWGDRQNGRLVQSAKGIGLSRALKALLDGAR